MIGYFEELDLLVNYCLIRFLTFFVCFADTSFLIGASELCHTALHTAYQHGMPAAADREIDLHMWKLAAILLVSRHGQPIWGFLQTVGRAGY